MGTLTFILGGARSGKSTFAERLATQRNTSVAYIATARPSDEEMAARIAVHRKKRPANWQTLEIPFGVGQALRSNPPEAEVIILDCLTLLVSNLLLNAFNADAESSDFLSGAIPNSGNDQLLSGTPLASAETHSEVIISAIVERNATKAIDQELIKLQEAIQSSSADWLIVSNEVGMGLVPPYPLGRLYRDLLGSANQRIASLADRVYFMVAGIPMRFAPEV